MKHLSFILFTSIFTNILMAQDVIGMLRKAADAYGEDYIEIRDRIIELGEEVVPELEAVLENEEKRWRERAMAGIVIEHIEKGDRIHAIIHHDWRNDPELKDDFGWKTRAGTPLAFFEVLEEMLDEAELNYYFFELAWKETGERPRVGTMGTINGKERAEKVNNPFLIHLARDRILNIPVEEATPRIRSNWFYRYLIRVRDRESLPHLFDLWIAYRPLEKENALRHYRDSHPHRSEEAIQRFANNDADLMLSPLLNAASPEDEPWIMEKLDGIELGERGRRNLERVQRRWRDPDGEERERKIDASQLGEGARRRLEEIRRQREIERQQNDD